MVKTTRISFYKMHGSGNDFVLIDNRKLGIPESSMKEMATKMCQKAFGIGADGAIFLDQPQGMNPEYDLIWHFYNADGSRAEMCGNGSRCAAWLGHKLNMVPAQHVLGTDAGAIRAEVFEDKGLVKVQLTDPFDLKTNISLDIPDNDSLETHHINTGVPHTVILFDDVENVDVQELGREIRFHKVFAPQGTNVNFIQIKDREHILLRTYERGVEDETYACGTGAAAAVYIAHELNLVEKEVQVTTSGGENLTIFLENNTLFLQGQAVLVFEGTLFLDALDVNLV